MRDLGWVANRGRQAATRLARGEHGEHSVKGGCVRCRGMGKVRQGSMGAARGDQRLHAPPVKSGVDERAGAVE